MPAPTETNIPVIPGGTLVAGPFASVYGTAGYLVFTFKKDAPLLPGATAPDGYEFWGIGDVSDGSRFAVIRPAKVKPVDVNIIQCPANGDLAAALALMGDGKTLEIQRGFAQDINIGWQWSNAKIRSYGDAKLPAPVIGGVTLAAACTDVIFDGFTVKGTPGKGIGIDWRAAKTERVQFNNLTAYGFSTGFSIHTPNHEKQPPDLWHKDIALNSFRATGARPARPNDPNDNESQGIYAAEVDGLKIVGCHFDDCGGKTLVTPRHHGAYLSQFLRNVQVINSAATRCSSYGFQSRSDGATIAGCSTYDCGMAIMLNGPSGTCEGNTVVRGHGHSKPWAYGKGGFDLHLGSGNIADNLVANGPQVMPAGYFQPPAFAIAYREQKATTQPWEWTKFFPDGSKRPLAKLGAGNVDLTATLKVMIDAESLLLSPPNAVAGIIAKAARGAVR